MAVLKKWTRRWSAELLVVAYIMVLGGIAWLGSGATAQPLPETDGSAVTSLPKPSSSKVSGPITLTVGKIVVRRLGPATELEVRFPSAIIAAGREAWAQAKSPIAIEPPVRGKFKWLSQRSGLFISSEPFALGIRYTIRPRNGLKTLAGKPVATAVLGRLATPPMGVEKSFHGDWVRDGSFGFKVTLMLNTAVDPKTAAAHCSFRNASGRVIAANVRHENARPRMDVHRSGLGWTSRFTWDRYPEKRATIFGKKDDKETVIPNRLIIEPSETLSVGKGWEFMAGRGLPAADGKHKISRDFIIKLGDISPNEVDSIYARNIINEGLSLHLEFDRKISQKVIKEPGRWIKITPAVEGLKIERNSYWLALKGNFKLGVKYKLRLDASLPDISGRELGEPYLKEFQFFPLPPRTYVSANANLQYSGGHRRFSFVSVNNSKTRLRVKLVDPQYLASTLEAYEREYPITSGVAQLSSGRWVDRSDGHPLSFDLVPGQVVFDENFSKSGQEVDQASKFNVPWDDILKGSNAGVAFISVEGYARGRRRCVTQAIVQLTDLGMTWKQAGGELLGWVFSQRTGLPVAGAKVSQMTSANKRISTATTDANGLAYLRMPQKKGWLHVVHGEDQLMASMGDWRNKTDLWSFGLYRSWDGARPSAESMALFTDRPLYRPGETIHLKGIARTKDNAERKELTGRKIVIICRDLRGDKVFESNGSLSGQGSFNADIPLPEGALGRYRIHVEIDNFIEDSHWVNVQEFKPDTFKIKFPGKTDQPAGTPLAIPMEAHYYFGKPLAKAVVKWSLTSHHSMFLSESLPGYSFDISYHLNEDESSEPTVSQNGEVQLDKTGGAIIRPDIQANPKFPRPITFNLEATVTDVNQQTLFGRREVLLHSSDYYLGIRDFNRVAWAGQPLPISVVAVDTKGKPLGRSVGARAVLKLVDWHSLPIQGAGNIVSFRNEKRIHIVSECELQTVAPYGESAARLVPRKAGLHVLEIHGEDGGGRPIMSAVAFYVSGPQPISWDYHNESKVTVVPDKSVYEAGETARLLIKTPIEGRALVTVERYKIRRALVVELRGNAPVIEVPINADDAPNIYVSVLLLRGADASRRKIRTAEFRMGYATLKVQSPETRLAVELNTSQSDYRPGREVVVSGVVRGHDGEPVANAEVTLYAVDEGILAMMPSALPDLHSIFNRPLPHSVDTFTMFPQVLSEDPSRTSFGNKGHLIGGGGSGSIRGNLRKDFLPCAYWNAALKTDERGRVEARFKAPDSLTRYRVMAVVHAGEKYGSAKSYFKVNKPLIVEASLPPFARKGDRIEALAVIHNQTDDDHEIRVALETTAPAKVANNAKNLTIPAHTSQAVSFPVEFTGLGTVAVTWQVTAVNEADLADGMASSITVRPPAHLLREIHFISSNAAEIAPLEDFNPELLEGHGTLTLQLSNSRLSELGESADYLLRYPYGCVEQTSSSLLPWLMLNDLPTLSRTQEEREKAIKHGVQRLLNMQVSSGGLGYWPGRRTALAWGTAYGGLALVMAKEKGAQVPDRAMERMAKYLSRSLRRQHDVLLGDQAMAVYTLVLMGHAEPAYHEVLYKKRAKLRSAERALLAMAIIMHQGSDKRVPELLRVPENLKNEFEPRFGGDERTLALRLLAWLRHRHDAPIVEKLTSQLIAARHNGHWRTTQGNAWGLIALVEYIRQVETGARLESGIIKWRGKGTPFKLNPKTGLATLRFEDAKQLKPSDLILVTQGKKRLYAQVKIEAQPASPIIQRRNNGFSVRRIYERVNPDGSVDNKGDWEVGDLVRVTLHVESQKPQGYVVIDDPLPAVLEGINQEFSTRAPRVGNTRGNWWSNHSEMRADRVLFFRDHLPPGNYTLRYLARVRAAGETIAPATKVEAMYQPNQFGLSSSRKIKTKSAQ